MSSILRALRPLVPVKKVKSPPGSYPYQIGTASGGRPSSLATLITPTRGSARNASRSSLLSAPIPETPLQTPQPFNERNRLKVEGCQPTIHVRFDMQVRH